MNDEHYAGETERGVHECAVDSKCGGAEGGEECEEDEEEEGKRKKRGVGTY